MDETEDRIIRISLFCDKTAFFVGGAGGFVLGIMFWIVISGM